MCLVVERHKDSPQFQTKVLGSDRALPPQFHADRQRREKYERKVATGCSHGSGGAQHLVAIAAGHQDVSQDQVGAHCAEQVQPRLPLHASARRGLLRQALGKVAAQRVLIIYA